ncbi:ephrin-A2 [Tachysurus ichikawai]
MRRYPYTPDLLSPPLHTSVYSPNHPATLSIDEILTGAHGASPHPNHFGKPCLKLKVYVKPADSSAFESPEPFLIDRSSTNDLQSCVLMLSAAVSVLMMTRV